jgi:hypothetical protein
MQLALSLRSNNTAINSTSIVDNRDGTYLGLYYATVAAPHQLIVSVLNIAVREPIYFSVLASKVSAIHSQMIGLQAGIASYAMAGVKSSFHVHLKDSYNNAVSVDRARVKATLTSVPSVGREQVFVKTDNQGSADIMTVSYTAFNLVDYTLHLAVGAVPVAGSPFTVRVQAGPLSLPATALTVQGSATSQFLAGAQAYVTIQPMDQFENKIMCATLGCETVPGIFVYTLDQSVAAGLSNRMSTDAILMSLDSTDGSYGE